jgi:hypothetical protein
MHLCSQATLNFEAFFGKANISVRMSPSKFLEMGCKTVGRKKERDLETRDRDGDETHPLSLGSDSDNWIKSGVGRISFHYCQPLEPNSVILLWQGNERIHKVGLSSNQDNESKTSGSISFQTPHMYVHT